MLARLTRLFSLCAAITALFALAAAVQAEDLELHHADFHARLGLKIYAVIGDLPQASELRATLHGPSGDKVVFDKKDKLAKEEVLTLNFRQLPKGSYALTVDLLDHDAHVLRSARREFDKPYDGLPRVGIDENNSLRVAGKLFFPVTSWGIGSKEADIDEWDKQINALSGYTFDDREGTIDGWKKALDLAQKRGKMVIGPFYGHYWPNGSSRRYFKAAGGEPGENLGRDREIKLDALTDYVKATKDHPALLMWDWLDEPELSNDANCVTPTEVRRWTDKCHQLDPQHPVEIGTGGDGFRRAKDNWMYKQRIKYTYLFNDIAGPHRVLLADVVGEDIYPFFGAELEHQKQTETKRPGIKEGWGTNSIENMCVSMDRMVEYNRNLAPFGAAVRTAPFKEPALAAPTAKELRVVFWTNIIHGAKEIVWFHYFGPTPPETKAEMARLLDQVTRLAPAVLGPDYPGAIAAKAADGRVDLFARQAEGDEKSVYLFTANIRETAAKATLTLDFAPAKIEVLDENRELKPDGKTFTDAFDPLAVHLYKVSR